MRGAETESEALATAATAAQEATVEMQATCPAE